MKILIIEDEKELAYAMGAYLADENYLCELAFTLEDARQKLACHTYDCVLLDLMLPDGSGLDLLATMNHQQRLEGVIILSAKNSVEDKVKGLQLGADDYLPKPFHQSELLARIYSVIRRKNFNNLNNVQFEEIEINLLSKNVKVNDQEINLTRKEFDLLVFFISNKNKVISKSALAEYLSGDIADMFDNHDFVYAHIKNLKKKLLEVGGNNYLKTLYGVGYKWEK